MILQVKVIYLIVSLFLLERWMTIPSPDAIRRIRSKSLESTGSTESLTSLLDHDSYNDASEIQNDATFDASQDKTNNEENIEQQPIKEKRCR